MAMDLRDPNVWISHLLENLPEEKLASALKDDNPNWEYIDGEIVKLGSLAHSQLDIPELQRRCQFLFRQVFQQVRYPDIRIA